MKRPGFEVDHSHPYSVEVKNKCAYTYTPLYAFISCTGANLPAHFIDYLLYSYIRNGMFTTDLLNEVAKPSYVMTTLKYVHHHHHCYYYYHNNYYYYYYYNKHNLTHLE
jgi:hypothetical protein